MTFSHTEDTGRLVLGFVSMFLASTVASAGGIGGGGIIGGILLVIFEFKWSNAVILAFAAVSGSTIAQFSVNFAKRHPFDQTRPIIYFDAILTLLPAQLGGAAIGVIIMPAFPASILVVTGTLVLIGAGLKLLFKGVSLYKKETQVRAASASASKAATAAASAAGAQITDLRPSLQAELERERADDAAAMGVVKIHNSRLAMEQASAKSHVAAMSLARSLSIDRGFKSEAAASGKAAPVSISAHFLALGSVEVEGDESLPAEHRQRLNSGALTAEDGRFYLTAPGALDAQEAAVRDDMQHLHDFQIDAIVLGLGPCPGPAQPQPQQRNAAASAGAGADAKTDDTTNSLSPAAAAAAAAAARDTKNPILPMKIAEPGSGRISCGSASSSHDFAEKGREPWQGHEQEQEQSIYGNTAHNQSMVRSLGHSLGPAQGLKRTPSVTAMQDLAVVTAANYKLPDLEYPWFILLVIFNMWLLYAICLLISKTKSISPSCSSTFFAIMGCAAIPLIGVILWGVQHIANRQFVRPETVLLGDMDFAGVGVNGSKKTIQSPTGSNTWGKSKLGGSVDSNDDGDRYVNMSSEINTRGGRRPNSITCRASIPPLTAFVIGILCSLIGIGGGELMGPLMLQMGFLPQVTSATTSFMSLASSTLNLIHYGIDGQLDFKWTAYCYAIGLFGGITGRKLSIYVVDTFGRPSINVFMLGSVLFLSVILLIDELASGDDDNYSKWTKICNI